MRRGDPLASAFEKSSRVMLGHCVLVTMRVNCAFLGRDITRVQIGKEYNTREASINGVVRES